MIVPGWEGPFNVKYLRHIKVVDEPYHTWNESMNHSVMRADLDGKSRWYHFEWAPKSVITRPSAGMKIPPARDMSRLPAWLGPVGARSPRSMCPPTAARVGGKRSCRRRCFPRRIPGLISIGLGDGQEAMIQSRCEDEKGVVQPVASGVVQKLGHHRGGQTCPCHSLQCHAALEGGPRRECARCDVLLIYSRQ